MRRVVLFTLLLLVISVTAQAKTTYRFAAICKEGVCLVGADGKSKLVLAKDTEDWSWTGLTISPSGRTLVAEQTGPGVSWRVSTIDALSGKTHVIPCAFENPQIPERPVWLDERTVLLQNYHESAESANIAVYSVNVQTGGSRQVVPRREDEWSYEHLLVSPDGKLVATEFGVTNASWISVNSLETGKQYWRTDPGHGFGGFTGMVWSQDSKSLLVSRNTGDDEFYRAPGGVWKHDAFSGTRKTWKYPGEDVWGMWADQGSKVLALGHGDQIEFMRAEDGESLAHVDAPSIGRLIDGLFTPDGSFLLCGDRRIAKISLPGYKTKSYPTHGLAQAPDLVRLSPDGNSVLCTSSDRGGPGTSGFVSLTTGAKTKIAPDVWSLTWLPKDIVR